MWSLLGFRHLLPGRVLTRTGHWIQFLKTQELCDLKLMLQVGRGGSKGLADVTEQKATEGFEPVSIRSPAPRGHVQWQVQPLLVSFWSPMPTALTGDYWRPQKPQLCQMVLGSPAPTGCVIQYTLTRYRSVMVPVWCGYQLHHSCWPSMCGGQRLLCLQASFF